MAHPSRFLDKYGLKYFADQIETKMGSAIAAAFTARITQIVDDASSDAQLPSAAAVWNLVSGAIKECIGVNFEVWEGDMIDGHPDITDPSPGTIYLVKISDDDDNLYTQWIYVAGDPSADPPTVGRWLNLGSTKCDLEGFWSESNLVALSEDDIDEILTEVWPGWTPPDPIDP